MSDVRRVLFGGYAPVHFLCFRPVYEALRHDPDIEIWLTGGFRRTVDGDDDPRYDLEGFYSPYGVDESRVAPFEQLWDTPFDTVVCAHSSTVFFPRQVKKAVQVFHGVSFKNFAVRDKVLKYDYACVAGRYHAEKFESQLILGSGTTEFLLTGFSKLDRLVSGELDRDALLRGLGLDPSLPTILYAPTGGKYNSLDGMGEELVRAIAAREGWNLLIKPHDHPKKAVDWPTRLAPYESGRVKVVRDFDIVPFLHAADLLLTDASSVAMEYSLMDRPMVFVDVPELLENVRKRGGALDLDTYGRKIGTIAAGPAEVVKAIAHSLDHPDEHAALRRSAASRLFHDPGGATGRVADVVRFAAGLRADLPEEIVRLHATGAAG